MTSRKTANPATNASTRAQHKLSVGLTALVNEYLNETVGSPKTIGFTDFEDSQRELRKSIQEASDKMYEAFVALCRLDPKYSTDERVYTTSAFVQDIPVDEWLYGESAFGPHIEIREKW